MRDQPFLKRNIALEPMYPFSIPSNELFVKILFAFNSCYVILIEWTFHYLVMCKSITTTVCVNSTAQFTFLLVMRKNIAIAMNCDLLIVIPVFVKASKLTGETCSTFRWNKIWVCQSSCGYSLIDLFQVRILFYFFYFYLVWFYLTPYVVIER